MSSSNSTRSHAVLIAWSAVLICTAHAPLYAQRYGSVFSQPRRAYRVAQAPGQNAVGAFRQMQQATEANQALLDALRQETSQAGSQPGGDALDNAVRNAAVRARQGGPETIGPANGVVKIPLNNPNIKVQTQNGLVSVVVRDAPLRDVIAMIGETLRLNVVVADGVEGTLSISLDRIPLPDALGAITSATGNTWAHHNGIIYVTALQAELGLAPEVQGRQFAVFELDYVAAEDISEIVAGLLTPVGQSFNVVSAEDDNRRAREAIVVEDVAASVNRIRRRIMQLDVPPRQVQIEAYVLEVELSDDNRHGVNLQGIFNLGSHSISLRTVGMADAAASKGFLAELSGPDLKGVIEWLQITSDAKTLASPSLTVLNNQSAKIQVGEQLGFRVTTTTDTSTTEGVETLDVGVLLEVTPQISRDGRILLHVRPEVSSGEVNPETGLPEEEVTELETNVMLENGKGIVIGGLIQERDIKIVTQLPYIGDIHHVGKWFSLRENDTKRSEIIIALIPRILPFAGDQQRRMEMLYDQATTPLTEGALYSRYRPWDPQFFDPVTNPIPCDVLKHELGLDHLCPLHGQNYMQETPESGASRIDSPGPPLPTPPPLDPSARSYPAPVNVAPPAAPPAASLRRSRSTAMRMPPYRSPHLRRLPPIQSASGPRPYSPSSNAEAASRFLR